MKRNIAAKKGNWASGTFVSAPPGTVTEFEERVRELRLTDETYLRSEGLRRWCKENRHRCYIPEQLLKLWGFSVDWDSN